MTPDRLAETLPTHKEAALAGQLQNFYTNFHRRVLNGSGQEETELDKKAEDALTHAITVIARNNRISEIHQSPDLQEIIDSEKQLRGEHVTIGKVYCIDGRLPVRPNESPLVNTWEEAAARIHITRRFSDNVLIPAQTNLCESIGNKADPRFDLLEIVLAHYDSTDPNHGCAAISLDINTLRTPLEQLESNPNPDQRAESIAAKKQLEEALSPEDIQTVLNAPTPEESNLIIAQKITLAAITNFYNTRREQADLPPLKQAGIVALNDTATMGFELRYSSNKLSSTEISNNLRDKLRDGNFGKFRYSFTDPERLIEISKEIYYYTHLLTENGEGLFLQTKNQIEKYIDANLPDLNENQKKGLLFIIARKVAFQYLTGLSQLPEDGYPNHPFAQHNEQDISVSVHGHLLGEFDSFEQHFGSSPAKESVIRQIKIANIVMDGNQPKKGETRVIFVNTPIHSKDLVNGNGKFAYEQALAQNASLFREIIQDPELCEFIKSGKILPIPVLIDDVSRKVLEIPDHSAYL